MSDYRVKITIRNDRILSKIEELGFPSVMKFLVKLMLNLKYIKNMKEQKNLKHIME
jgi:hypothetical protein